jgi:hypothetical protein
VNLPLQTALCATGISGVAQPDSCDGGQETLSTGLDVLSFLEGETDNRFVLLTKTTFAQSRNAKPKIMLFNKHFIGAALTLFFCGWTGRNIQASHPMRIVLDENGKYQ